MYPTNRGYAQSQGLRLLEAAVRHFGPIFTLEQIEPLAAELQISSPQLRWLLSSLGRSGWIEKLNRGVYAAKSNLFTGEISPFAIAAALANPIAISHWSALAHHGFTTQIPSMVQASTPRKVITPEMRKGRARSPRGRAVWQASGIEVEFIHVQPKYFFGHNQIWVNSWQQVAITDPERTALDLVARSDIFGGMAASIEILEEVISQINPEILIGYALQYNAGAVIKRLGWILENLEIPEQVTNPLQTYPVNTTYRLDPKSAASAQRNPRWRIIENLRRSDARS
jgi:predicted transcriptional regulator of viral defense system